MGKNEEMCVSSLKHLALRLSGFVNIKCMDANKLFQCLPKCHLNLIKICSLASEKTKVVGREEEPKLQC